MAEEPRLTRTLEQNIEERSLEVRKNTRTGKTKSATALCRKQA